MKGTLNATNLYCLCLNFFCTSSKSYYDRFLLCGVGFQTHQDMSLIKKFCTLAWARLCNLNVEISSKQSRKTTKNRPGAQKHFGRRENHGLKRIKISGPNNKRHDACS